MTTEQINDLILYFEQRANSTGEHEMYSDFIIALKKLL